MRHFTIWHLSFWSLLYLFLRKHFLQFLVPRVPPPLITNRNPNPGGWEVSSVPHVSSSPTASGTLASALRLISSFFRAPPPSLDEHLIWKYVSPFPTHWKIGEISSRSSYTNMSHEQKKDLWKHVRPESRIELQHFLKKNKDFLNLYIQWFKPPSL